MPRTVSIISNVGPAVTMTLRPASLRGARKFCTDSRISSGSSMRPMPTSPQAWSPGAGPITVMPSARSVATLRCVAGLSHISTFIAGATSSGQLRARHAVERRSSAMPLASFARKSALAGATTIASAPRESSMCAMLLAKLASHRSVITGLPVSAWNVAGVTKRVAASVIATCTSTLFLMRRRASSATL